MFSKKVLILLCVLIIGGVYVTHSIKIQKVENVRKDSLTFSNTQTWDPLYLSFAHTRYPFTQEQLDALELPFPPSNTSVETQQELKQLHDMISLRTPEKIQEIENELNIPTTVFGTTSIETFINPTIRPYTSKLIDLTSTYAGYIVFYKKEKYDRVRPSILDPSLSTAIDIPNHPAYPSGHSIQSHLFAAILSKLSPKNSEMYFESAERITHNREIAGVHYPSDSKAGALLAEQVLPLFFDDPEFLKLFALAQTEW